MCNVVSITAAQKILKLICRFFPQAHGKFRILNDVYFGRLAPKQDTWVVEKLRNNLQMNLNIAEFLQAHLFLFGSYELPTVKFLERTLKPDYVCFDVGAQIGYLSLVMANAAQRRTRVVAFEPEELNTQRFASNMALNNITNVELVKKAVSNTSGVLKLYLSNDNNAGTHSTIANDPNVGTAFEEVAAVALDEIVEQLKLGRLDMIKIDVEGAELEVIQGAKNVLSKFRPTCIIELSENIQKSRGFSTTQFKKLMSEYGYHSFVILDNGSLSPVETDTVHAMDNVVFVHRDRIQSKN